MSNVASPHHAETLVIQLGFPKTATTALQRGLFAQEPTIAYLGKRARSDRVNEATEQLIRSLKWSSKRFWSERGAALVDDLLTRAAEAGIEGDPLLVSDEGLLGSCFGTLRVCSRPEWGTHVGHDPEALAESLEALGRDGWSGHLRVLVTVRRQDTFLASLFAQTFLWRNASPQYTLERFIEKTCNSGFYSNGGLALDYDWLMGRLEEALGVGNVTVMIYEDMVSDPDRIGGILQELVNADPDRARELLGRSDWKVRSSDQQSWRVQRYRGSNRLRHAAQWLERRWQGVPNPARIELTPEQSRSILDVYGQSNRRFAQRIGRNLSDYGYY